MKFAKILMSEYLKILIIFFLRKKKNTHTHIHTHMGILEILAGFNSKS
jgi:hypothetical protein